MNIPKDLSPPIEYNFQQFASQLGPTFQKYHFTPLSISLLAAVGQGYSLYLYKQNQYLNAGIFYLLGYFISVLADVYVHQFYSTDSDLTLNNVVRISTVISYMYFMYSEKSHINRTVNLLLIVILILSYVNRGCQHRYSDTTSPVCYCPASTKKEATQTLSWSRFFSSGSAAAVLFFYLLLKYRTHRTPSSESISSAVYSILKF